MMMSYRLIGRVLLLACLFSVPGFSIAAGCKVKNTAELQGFFDQAIEANENFKRTVFEGQADSESRLDAQDDYIEHRVIPCAVHAAAILAKENNPSLMESYMNLVISYENLTEDTLDVAFGRIFAKNPALVEKAIAGFSSTDHKLVFNSVSKGFDAIKGGLKSSVAADREERLKELNID